MKVLFFMRSTVYVRNFESTLRLLVARGHHLHVVADPHVSSDSNTPIEQLCRESPRITHSRAPKRPINGWSLLGGELRRALDYLRYLEPEYRNAPKLRRRARKTAPAWLVRALEWPFVDTPAGRWLLGAGVRWCDRAVPRDPAVDAFVRAHGPDLVLVTPLVEPGSPQSEYVRSARALGIPVGLCVYSWDNLTNKGLIHDSLDLVTVWNEPMKREATMYHRVAPDRIVVTGAAAYDHWFGWRPRVAHEAFCARAGLDARRSYLLYVCSSRFVAPNEVPFVRRWIQDIRSASERLRGVGVLVRPHPQNAERWRDADLSDLDNVAVWPRGGANPLDDGARADYFDSIYHSAAVVGVNTSAQIESAIVGRGVYAWLAPEFQDTQDGTLHFQHLRNVNGGLLHLATDVADHAAQLELAVRDPDAAATRCRQFVEAFVRPHGLEEAATPRLVAALEATAGRVRRRQRRDSWSSVVLRPGLAPAAKSLENAERAVQAARARTGSGSGSVKQGSTGPQPAGGSSVVPAGSEVFEIYSGVREWAGRLRALEPPRETLALPERRMLAALTPVWDVTPDTLPTLRHRGEAISGVRAADYDGDASALEERLARDLRRLLAKGYPALRVDEPGALGGFGVNGHGHLYNEDTLRFFRVFTLLQDAALLKDFRDGGARRTVWEIGAGWGGFAYQFKTLCPNVTYLITAPADLMLLSAVYLQSLFPSATFRFYEPTVSHAFWDRWDTVDFVFVPESVIPEMQPPSLDLTVDLMALERMTPPRIAQHVARAYELGARHFFSICPAADPDPALAAPVRSVVERCYWPHPVSAPAFVSWRLGLRSDAPDPVGRTFLLAWRRLRTRDA
jgi:hypothetical protein